MSRYRASEATVTITPVGGRLLVRWSSTRSRQIQKSFRGEGWRHGEATWNARMRAWSVSVYGRPRLEAWLGSTFAPECVTWEEQQAQARARGVVKFYQRGERGEGEMATSGERITVAVAELVPHHFRAARFGEDPELIDTYVEAFDDLPPITIWEIPDHDHDHEQGRWAVLDGVHRLRAAERLERAQIEARVFVGTAKGAEVEALVANAVHGKRLSAAETRAAIRRLLLLECGLSHRAIARQFGVTHPTVLAIAHALELEQAYEAHLGSQDLGHKERTERLEQARALPEGEKARIWHRPRAEWPGLLHQATTPPPLVAYVVGRPAQEHPAEELRTVVQRPAQEEPAGYVQTVVRRPADEGDVQDERLVVQRPTTQAPAAAEEDAPEPGHDEHVWFDKMERLTRELERAGERAARWYTECEVLFAGVHPELVPRLHALRDRLRAVADQVRARAEALYEDGER